MAYLNSAAIRTAIEEQLNGTKTGTRAVTNGVMTTGIYADLPAEEQARRALVEPRFDVAITSIKRVGPLGTTGSYQLLLCDIDVRSIYALTEREKIDDAQLDTLRSTGTDDLDRIQQALCYGVTAPLATTSVGVATGIVSGVMSEYLGGKLVREDFALRRIEFLSQFRCVVKASPATSATVGSGGEASVIAPFYADGLLSSLPTSTLLALDGLPTTDADAAAGAGLFNGVRYAKPNTAIGTGGIIITQRVDGSSGTTVAEVYRLRSGTWTSLGSVSLAFGGGGNASSTLTPTTAALRSFESGDVIACALVTAQVAGEDLTITIALG